MLFCAKTKKEIDGIYTSYSVSCSYLAIIRKRLNPNIVAIGSNMVWPIARRIYWYKNAISSSSLYINHEIIFRYHQSQLNYFSNSGQVWCDMFTDGGGWLLVGRKNSSVTWTVPSSSNPVEPFGDPHWSSSLGDAQIVDFRVQVATKKDFSTTRADWYVLVQNNFQKWSQVVF
jgi:hypothetical protein